MNESERIKELSLEDAVKELEKGIVKLNSDKLDDVAYFYIHMLNDRRYFKAVDVEEHYAGRKDGTFHPLARARLKLLSYHMMRLKDDETTY